MKDTVKLLQSLVYCGEYLKATIKEGIAALEPYAKDLEAVYIKLVYPDPSIWRKKKYYCITRHEVCSRLKDTAL